MEQLTPLRQKLMAILHTSNESWLIQRQIAEGLGRKQLTPYDRRTLRSLLRAGLIEGQVRVIGRGFQYLYRVKQDSGSASSVQKS